MKKKPVHAMVTEAVTLFKQHHGGVAPTRLVAEQDALVLAALEGKLGLKGIPVVAVPGIEKTQLRRPGEGRALALFLVELPGSRFGTAVTEIEQ